MSLSIAERFRRLFLGLEKAYGRYVVTPGTRPDDKGKMLGAARQTIHEAVTEALWQQHLEGADERGPGFGIGVVPIRDDSTCSWGAIDVDVYPLDLGKLERAVRASGYPLTLCRTKSGGAHLYLFCKEPVPAALVRGKLVAWADALGYPGVEVFPKQTKVTAQDTGNWINMPYRAALTKGGTNRYALAPDGAPLSAEAFLSLAAERSVDRLTLEGFASSDAGLVDASDGDEWREAPPCLVHCAKHGFGDWQNFGLYNISIYLQKRYGDGWDAHLAEYNDKYLQCDDKTVAATTKSLSKKTYSYKCKEEPICSVCDKPTCQDREYGVGGRKGSDPGVVFGKMVKINMEEPKFVWEVNGRMIMFDPQMVLNQQQFQLEILKKLTILTDFVKPTAWTKLVKDALAKIETRDAPKDSSRDGQLMVHLKNFCTSRVKGRSLDELLMKKPYTDPDKGRAYFCSSDFIAYLQTQRFPNVTPHELWAVLQQHDVKAATFELKGRMVDAWSVPAFDEQTKEHDVPVRSVEAM